MKKEETLNIIKNRKKILMSRNTSNTNIIRKINRLINKMEKEM